MISELFRLDGKVAIVTGSGRGIGAAIATALAEAGARVVISSRTESDLTDVARAIEDAGSSAHQVVADLSDSEHRRALVSAAIATFGRVDILVNSVSAPSHPKPLAQTTGDDLLAAYSANVVGAHEMINALLPHLLDNEGSSIVNIGSTMGSLPARGFAANGSAKAALAHYTKITAMDLCPRIRVNAIAPGLIETPGLQSALSISSVRAHMLRSTPLRRLGRPQDVAAVALLLTSEAGAFITGKVIEVDGGIIAPNITLPIDDL